MFLLTPRRKWWPRIVIVSPTKTFFGVTLLTTGALLALAVAVPVTGTRQCGCRGHQAGAAQRWANAGSEFHRPRYRRAAPMA